MTTDRTASFTAVRRASRSGTYRFLALIFVAGAVGSPISSLLPVFVDAVLHHPPSYTAGLKSLQLVATGVFALVGGALADRIGQKRALVISFCGVGISSLIFTLSNDLALVVIITGLGVTSSLQTVSGQSYVVAAANRNRLGGMTALYYLGNTLGGAVGNAIAGPSAGRFGFGSIGWAGFALSIVLVGVAIWWLPDVQGRDVSRSPGIGALLADYLRLARRPRMAGVGALRFLPTSLYGMTGLVIPLLVYRLSGSVAVAGAYATTSLLVATATQLTVGRFVDRAGPVLPTRVLISVIVAASVVAAVSAASVQLIFAMGVVLTASLWGMSTTMTSLVRETCSSAEQGRALGLVHLLWSLGMLVGTLGGGWLVGVSSGLPFAVFAALNVPSVAIALRLDRRTLEAQESLLSV